MNAQEQRMELDKRYRELRKRMVRELTELAVEDYKWQRFARGVGDKNTAAGEVEETVERLLNGLQDDMDSKLGFDNEFNVL